LTERSPKLRAHRLERAKEIRVERNKERECGKRDDKEKKCPPLQRVTAGSVLTIALSAGSEISNYTRPGDYISVADIQGAFELQQHAFSCLGLRELKTTSTRRKQI
jgi:hypothetical protein